MPAPGCSPRASHSPTRANRGGGEGTLALGRALPCAHTAGPLRTANNGSKERESDQKEPRRHSGAAKRDCGPRGEVVGRRAILRRHEPPRLGYPGNIASGSKTFSPLSALCSGPIRSRLSSSTARAAPSLPAHRSACSVTRLHRKLRGLHGRRSLAALPRPLPPPSTIASPGAPHGPERSRCRAARTAPYWLPPQERTAAARPHCPPRSRRIPPSRRRTGREPNRPAQRTAFPPHRPPPPRLSSPAATQLPAGEGRHGGLCLPAVCGARPAQPSPGPLKA